MRAPLALGAGDVRTEQILHGGRDLRRKETAEKRSEPPEAFKGKCSFLPLSLFDPDGKGYWMMFQDAETGQCVKISQK